MSTKMPFMSMPSPSYARVGAVRWIDGDAWAVNLCSGTTHAKRLIPGDPSEAST
jgi:hypothetical protein